MQLDQAKLGTFRHFLVRGMEDQNVQIYYENMIYFANKLGAERDRAAKELKESLDFEIRLAEVSERLIIFWVIIISDLPNLINWA